MLTCCKCPAGVGSKTGPYREKRILDRNLLPEEVKHSANTARRIGAILQLVQGYNEAMPTGTMSLGACPRISSWRRNPPRNNLLTALWTLSWSN